MTKFEELQDIIARNKNKGKAKDKNYELDSDDDNELEVAGSEGTKQPLISCGDDETDPDLLDQLHRSYKTKPNNGSNSAPWDSDY
jgi:trehalose-6-phosphatase